MASVASTVPPEIIICVLHLALRPSIGVASVDRNLIQKNYDVLRAASLVGRRWRGPAQSLLLDLAYISTSARATALFTSGKLGETRVLYISGITKDIASSLIERAIGVRCLVVQDVSELPASALFHPSMASESSKKSDDVLS